MRETVQPPPLPSNSKSRSKAKYIVIGAVIGAAIIALALAFLASVAAPKGQACLATGDLDQIPVPTTSENLHCFINFANADNPSGTESSVLNGQMFRDSVRHTRKSGKLWVTRNQSGNFRRSVCRPIWVRPVGVD